MAPHDGTEPHFPNAARCAKGMMSRDTIAKGDFDLTAAGAAGCSIWIKMRAAAEHGNLVTILLQQSILSLRRARERLRDYSDPFLPGRFDLRLFTKADWDGFKNRASMHFHHSVWLRGLQDLNYCCQGPYRTGMEGKTKEAKWHAAN